MVRICEESPALPTTSRTRTLAHCQTVFGVKTPTSSCPSEGEARANTLSPPVTVPMLPRFRWEHRHLCSAPRRVDWVHSPLGRKTKGYSTETAWDGRKGVRHARTIPTAH
jgi:hypothetical protein